MIFRAKFPSRMISIVRRKSKRYQKTKDFFLSLKREVQNCVYALNSVVRTQILFDTKTTHVFVICNNRPLNSPNFTWEGIGQVKKVYKHFDYYKPREKLKRSKKIYERKKL
jgi:hypothetical protein